MNKYTFISRIMIAFEENATIIRIYTDGIIMEGTSILCYPEMTRVNRHDVSLARRACKGKIRQIAKLIPREMEVVFYDCERPEDPCDPDDRYIVEHVKIPRSNIVRALGTVYKLCTQSYVKTWKEAGFKM